MKKYWLYILFFSLPVAAQDAGLTLQEAIETGLKNNYSIILQKNEAARAANNFTLGNAGMLPQLDATVIQNNSILDTRQEFATGNIVDRNGAESSSLNATASLGWTIFDGFSMFAAYDKLKEYRHAGELNLRLTMEDAVEQIIGNYFDIVRQQALLGVIDSSRILSDIKLNIAKTRYQVGSGSRLDFLQAQIDRNADETMYKKQVVAIASAKIRLNQLLGRAVDTGFNPVDSMTYDALEYIDTELSAASSANTELLLAGSSLEVSRLTVKELRGTRLPFIDLNAGYSFTRSSSEAGIVQENRSQGINYGFTIRWNLFNGFNTGTAIKNAKLDYSSAEVRMNEIKSLISAEVRMAYLQLQGNIEIVLLEKQNWELAKENMELSVERFRTGLTSELQFKEAQQSYIDAFSRLISSQYDAKLSEVNLKRLTGKLLK